MTTGFKITGLRVGRTASYNFCYKVGIDIIPFRETGEGK